jgi:Fe-S-cluster containining protein
MVGADNLARQLQRYGRIISENLALDAVYNEKQCRECTHGHRCCDLMVTITPYEALGIMSWLKANVDDWRGQLELVKMRAESMREFIADKEGKTYFETPEEMIAAWYQRGFKCVFYDLKARNGAGSCSIYPVRPVNCRKAFGKGDCENDKASGIASMAEDPALYETRANRVKIRQLEAFGQDKAEMCSLITMLRNPDVTLVSEPVHQKLMETQTETLTDDQVLWGLGARPMENPWNEED